MKTLIAFGQLQAHLGDDLTRQFGRGSYLAEFLLEKGYIDRPRHQAARQLI